MSGPVLSAEERVQLELRQFREQSEAAMRRWQRWPRGSAAAWLFGPLRSARDPGLDPDYVPAFAVPLSRVGR